MPVNESLCCQDRLLREMNVVLNKGVRVNRIVTAMLIVVAVIHLLPVSGVLSGEQLSTLYGLSFEEPNIEILMRHRSVLFGILGAFLMFSAFKPKLHIYALVAATVSVVSFLYFAWSVGGYNDQVGRVYIADLVALLSLGVAFVAYLALKLRGNSEK